MSLNTTAESAPKLATDEAFQQYAVEMNRNVDEKTRVIDEQLPELKKNDVVVDLGCASGQVVNQLAALHPDSFFVGMDLSISFLEKFYKDQTKHLPNVGFVQANGYELPFAKKSVKAFILSSFLHEIYSYESVEGTSFSKDNIALLFNNLKKCLTSDGEIIIKDPAKPEHPAEMHNMIVQKTVGITSTDYNELLKHPVKELSIYSRYIRFLHEFKALQNVPELQKQLLEQIQDPNKDVFQLPAWVISEFIRHRDLCVTDGNWSSEMMEQYGTLTKKELHILAGNLGLKVKNLEIYYNENHYSRIKNHEIILADTDGNIIKPEERFPTNMVAVLGKKNDLEIDLSKEKIKRINVAAVIVNEEGKILYCQRSDIKKFLPGIWHLPGGKVENGESFDKALKREIAEELNLNIINTEETAYRHIYPNSSGGNHCTVFLLAKATGNIKLDFENKDWKFLSPDELPNYLEPHVLDLNQEICHFALQKSILSQVS